MPQDVAAREPSLPPSVTKVVEAAKALGLSIAPRLMPASTRTAQEAAAACGCAVAQIVKSLVVHRGDERAQLSASRLRRQSRR